MPPPDFSRPSQAQSFAAAGFASLANAKSGYTSVVNVTLPSQRVKEIAKLNEMRNPYEKPPLPEEEKSIDSSTKAKSKEVVKDAVIEALEERLCGKGIGNALLIFRERGMLG